MRDFRFGQRIASENEAIRRLIEAGLNATAATAVASPAADTDKVSQVATPAPDQPAESDRSKPRRPRAKPLLMSKEAQIRALRERDA